MQIQYTKNLNPGRFELGTTLSWPNRSKPMHKICRCQIYCSQTRLLVVLHRSRSNEMYQKAWCTCRIVVVVLVFLFRLWKLFSWPSSLWLFKLVFQEVEHSGIQVLPVPFFFENRTLLWKFPKASGPHFLITADSKEQQWDDLFAKMTTENGNKTSSKWPAAVAKTQG